MKLFAKFGMSVAKTGIFVDIFTDCLLPKRTDCLFQSSQISFIVVSVDNNGIAKGKQRGRLAANNHC